MSKFKKIKKIISIMLILVLLVSCSNVSVTYDADDILAYMHKTDDDYFADGFAKKLVIPVLGENKLVNNISAESYFIASEDATLSKYARYKDPYKQMYIASITKLMTCLVTLKYYDDLDKICTVSSNAVDLSSDASVAKLKFGDRISVKDLLYAMLLPSGNDAALVLAESLDGSLDNFIIKMNNEANNIGALHTHFSNPHGMDDKYNYSTCYDIYLILTELLKYPLFSEITNTKEWATKILQSDNTYRDITWQNTNFFVMGDLIISDNVSLVGGKTGTTNNAGNCLALVTKRKTDNMQFISVVLNANSKKNLYRNMNQLLVNIE